MGARSTWQAHWKENVHHKNLKAASPPPPKLKCKNTVGGRAECFPHFLRHGFIKA